MVQPIKNTYTQTKKKKNKKKSIKNEVYGGLHIFAMCIAYSVWTVSTHTQDNPFQQDYNKSKPKTLALSLSLPLLSLPLYFHGAPTPTKEAIEDQVHTLSLYFFFIIYLWFQNS